MEKKPEKYEKNNRFDRFSGCFRHASDDYHTQSSDWPYYYCTLIVCGLSMLLRRLRGLLIMIDWEEISRTEDADELKEAKLWLFQENIRLQNERKEFEAVQDKFLKERVCFRREMEELNRRTVMERKRLKEENLFFEKKLTILQDGFRQLEEDRRSLDREKKALEEERTSCFLTQNENALQENTAQILFRGINNSLALRKRYKDLLKIFHPDNLFGDEELVQMINREYLRRKKDE